MKRTITLIAVCFIITSLLAQTPNNFSYQAIIRNNDNQLITEQTIGMQISIIQGTIYEAPVYVETQSPTSDINGLISIEIGNGEVMSGEFDAIDWSNGPCFIKVETDPNGGDSYAITTTNQLLSVPFALYANEAGNSFSGDYNDLVNSPIITDDQNLSEVLNENNDANALQIKNIANPTEAQDAATKAYVDELISLFEGNGMVVVDFTADNTIISLGNSVSFTDNSVLEATSWQWDFGDGNTSTEQNPTHVYEIADTFTVSLTASNGIISQTKIKPDYIITTDGPTLGTFIDSRDGKEYVTVTIENQEWMAENLAYLPSVNQVTDGSEDIDGSYYYVYGYNGTDVSEATATENYNTYGVLYNWNAAMAGGTTSNTNPSGVQGVCPDGWHLPSNEEWNELQLAIGISIDEIDVSGWHGTNEGSKLAGNEELWIDGELKNSSEFNSTGFTGLPSGYRSNEGEFSLIGNNTWWWSATQNTSEEAYYIKLDYNNSSLFFLRYYKSCGYSVRCLRD